MAEMIELARAAGLAPVFRRESTPEEDLSDIFAYLAERFGPDKAFDVEELPTMLSQPRFLALHWYTLFEKYFRELDDHNRKEYLDAKQST